MKGYAFISEKISFEGLAEKRFDNIYAMLISVRGFDLNIAQKWVDAMGLRFGDIYELVAFNAMYRSRFPTRGEHTIFAPGSTYEVKLGDDPHPYLAVAASVWNKDKKLRLVTAFSFRGFYMNTAIPHYVLAFRK